ncbi:MAG: transglutaminase family protein [Acidobacteriaceae bacterium]|nr:transglutaminase family protein [Acidobacteriaceae bacterium]
MLIRLGYDIQFYLPQATPFIALLSVHPSRETDLVHPDELKLDPELAVSYYLDVFGNRCARFVAGPGTITLRNDTLMEDSGELDPENPEAREVPVNDLPDELLQFLLPSRYCEVDALAAAAADLFGEVAPGWNRVQAICSWVYQKVRFGYGLSRPTKTALDVYTERTGVCRDFQHLAITFCRALNIPARYATGYLGDIGVPPAPTAMDFSAWFEAYLEDRWWTFDARHNARRIGRVLMATGRDAADVALTTTFGPAELQRFVVITEEQAEMAVPVRTTVAVNGD